MIGNIKADKKYHQEMGSKSLRVIHTIIEAPIANPPKGFDTSLFISVYQKKKRFAAGRVFSGYIELTCFNYTSNLHETKGIHKEDEHGSTSIKLNDLENTYQAAYAPKNICNDIGYPYIFSLPEIRKQSDWRLMINGKYRVLKKKDRPIFTPLTVKNMMNS